LTLLSNTFRCRNSNDALVVQHPYSPPPLLMDSLICIKLYKSTITAWRIDPETANKNALTNTDQANCRLAFRESSAFTALCPTQRHAYYPTFFSARECSKPRKFGLRAPNARPSWNTPSNPHLQGSENQASVTPPLSRDLKLLAVDTNI
jgi:hypothetical protein